MLLVSIGAYPSYWLLSQAVAEVCPRLPRSASVTERSVRVNTGYAVHREWQFSDLARFAYGVFGLRELGWSLGMRGSP